MSELNFKSERWAGIHETAAALHKVGGMTDHALSEITKQAIVPPAPLTAQQIKAIRTANNVSQPVFAAAMNVASSTVKSWEQGRAAPAGGNLRLLYVIQHNGLGVLAGA